MITSFTVAEGVTVIGFGAFSNCPKLASMEGIGEGVMVIEEYAFQYCRGLETLRGLPESLRTIETKAFKEAGFTSLYGLPSKVTSIGDYARVKGTIPGDPLGPEGSPLQ